MSAANIVTSLRAVGLDPLSSVVASVSELYRLPDDDLCRMKTALIADSFRFHYDNNAYYRNACLDNRVHPDDIREYEDLITIPLVPIAKFKSATSHELLSKPLNQIEHEMRSTGPVVS